MKTSFDHEKLSVYQEAIRCEAWVEISWKQLVMLVPIVSMRVGLIRSTSADRVHEEPAE